MRPRLAPGWPFSRGRFVVGEGGREGEGGKPPNCLRRRRTCAPRPQRLAEARDSRFAICGSRFAVCVSRQVVGTGASGGADKTKTKTKTRAWSASDGG